MLDNHRFTPQPTADGSFTFFSEEAGESFHSIQGAKEESRIKFVEPCQLVKKSQQPRLKIIDICYGLGYNSASALETIWANNPSCQVELVALELDQAVAKAAIAYNLLNSWSQPIPQLLEVLANSGQIQTEQLQAQLLLGDARITIQKLSQSNWKADAIFLDPFSPRRCPQLWTIEFISQLANCCDTTGRLATYSCAAAIRTALLRAGFKIAETPAVDSRQPGTIASWQDIDLPLLPKKVLEHLQTHASVPYRDPQLSDLAPVIWQRRQLEQQSSQLEPTSHWKKRWTENRKLLVKGNRE
ncbi:MAG: MnmC family methyltransferase [Coleofasciculaceae cyanobacterium]